MGIQKELEELELWELHLVHLYQIQDEIEDLIEEFEVVKDDFTERERKLELALEITENKKERFVTALKLSGELLKENRRLKEKG